MFGFAVVVGEVPNVWNGYWLFHDWMLACSRRLLGTCGTIREAGGRGDEQRCLSFVSAAANLGDPVGHAALLADEAGVPIHLDGARMIGSLFILEVEDLAAARRFAAGDPYAKAGLFASTEINPWRWLIESGKPRQE